MTSTRGFALQTLVGVFALLALATSCQTAPGPSSGTLEIPSGREPNAAVSGIVTYCERIALTPGRRSSLLYASRLRLGNHRGRYGILCVLERTLCCPNAHVV